MLRADPLVTAAGGFLSGGYRIGELAARAGVKTVVLTHLTPLASGDDYSAWAEEVRKHFSAEVLIAKDPMEF
jgi:ribonuclease BN (tRNA processing enzyme)